MKKSEWLKTVKQTRLNQRYGIEHIIELLAEITFPLDYICVSKINGAYDGMNIEWTKHFKDAQSAAGFVFDECELFNNMVTSFYYSADLNMVGILLESNEYIVP